MITEMIMNLISNATTTIINLISGAIPTLQIGANLIDRVVQIIQISEQSINFVHFIVGDTMVIIIPMLVALLTYKYLVYPILDFGRRLIPFVNL